MNNITLEEFFKSKDKLAIHCDTPEKALKLLKEFDKMGEKWNNGESYLNCIDWNIHKQDTLYTNDNKRSHNLSNVGYTIYEFEDIILDIEPQSIPELFENMQKMMNNFFEESRKMLRKRV